MTDHIFLNISLIEGGKVFITSVAAGKVPQIELLNSKLLINNSRTTLPTEILMLFLSFSDGFRMFISFFVLKSVDNFMKVHKIC